MKKSFIVLLAVAMLVVLTSSQAYAERRGSHTRKSYTPTYHKSVVYSPYYSGYRSYVWVPSHWQWSNRHRTHVRVVRYEPSPEFMLFYSISKIVQNCR